MDKKIKLEKKDLRDLGLSAHVKNTSQRVIVHSHKILTLCHSLYTEQQERHDS